MAGRAFWDSSALLTLLVDQTHSDRGRELVRVFPELVVWWGSSVEIRSALARLEREGKLTRADRDKVLEKLARQRLSWRLIFPRNRVRRIAERLPDSHDLRAADAFQLAAALVWCSSIPRDHALVTFDKKLAVAAANADFIVHRELVP